MTTRRLVEQFHQVAVVSPRFNRRYSLTGSLLAPFAIAIRRSLAMM